MDQPVQLIGPDGTTTAESRYRRDLPPETLVWLYENLVVTRDLDVEFVNLQRQGELALYASCRGQEAAQIGAAACLRKTDWLFPQFRELGVFLVRGIAPAQVAALWRGAWHGGLDFTSKVLRTGRRSDRHQHRARRGRGDGRATAGRGFTDRGFIGDGGATSEGDTHEAMNLAAVEKAPCIFYIQNNQWAISVPASRQYAVPTLAHRADGYGMPGIRVDGNDILACYAVMSEAAARARAGDGPTLIEAVTYRMEPHTTSDDATRYRTAEEIAEWSARDPIARYRTYLQQSGVLTERIEKRVQARSVRLRAELRDAVVGAPDLDVGELFDHVYAEITPELSAQREQLRAELAGGTR